MNMKEIKELLDLVVDKGLTEFELERSGMRLRVKRDLGRSGSSNDPAVLAGGPVISYTPIATPVPAPAPQQAIAAPAAPAAPTPAAPPAAANLYTVKSPIVGTFYGSPSPDAPPFVKPGDGVKAGQTLCIIEAMKLMNEIESDVAGEIVEQLVQNGQPVEYGQPLFAIRLPK